MQRIALILPWRSPRDVQMALDHLVGLNLDIMRRTPLPRLYSSGVVYQREGISGVERWYTAPLVLQQGGGDCEELAAWRAAELRMRGVEATPKLVRSAPNGWHVVVKTPSGIEDPSKRLGMP